MEVSFAQAKLFEHAHTASVHTVNEYMHDEHATDAGDAHDNSLAGLAPIEESVNRF